MIELIQSEPVVTFRETATETSSQICLSKSQNKHNRLYATAEPLVEELCKAIESGEVTGKEETKVLAKLLSEGFEWDPNDAKKIWCFGPDQAGPNVIVEQTKGAQFLNEIKDSVQAGFNWVTKEGALCQEELRGVRFNLVDVNLIADSIHRGAGQIINPARRVFYASQLTARPRLQEPVFLCEVQAPDTVMGGIYSCFSARRGIVIGEEPIAGTPLVNIRAYLPVAESFGFAQHLREATSGKAFPQCVFDHWSTIASDPYEASSKAFEIVEAIRKRKGLKPGIPALDQFHDKL